MRRRVLIVAPFPPRHDGRHGGSRAIAQLLVGLAERHDVALLVQRRTDEPDVDTRVAEACARVEEVAIPRVPRRLLERVRHRARVRFALLTGLPTWAAERRAPDLAARLAALVREWDPHVVQLEYRIMAQVLPAIPASYPCVLVDHDPVGSEAGVSRLLAPLERRAWRRLARLAARHARAVVIFTERDRAVLELEMDGGRVVRIPLGYELPATPLDPTGTRPGEILFVGSFVHPPNVEAARWLALEIFPSVKRRLSTATLRLVGSEPPPHVLALRSRAIQVDGDVDSVWPYLDAAAVVAAPIRTGGGMRIKVLEALVAGKALVATPLAVEGLELKHGEQVLIAESPAQFAGALVALLEDIARRRALAQAARRWAEVNLDVDAQVRRYVSLYNSILGSSAAPRVSDSAAS